MSEEPPATDRPVGGRLLDLAITFVPQAGVATGLLFYFGWVRTSVESQTMGLSDSVFGYTTQDYVMRSIDALFVPIVAAVTIGLLALLIHGRLRARSALRPVRVLAILLLPACVLLPALSYAVEARWPQLRGLVLPLGMVFGVLLSAYGATLRRPAGDRRLQKALLTVLVAVTLFWWVGNFAAVVGRGLAYRVAAGIDERPGVIVYSPKDLQLSVEGVHVTHLPGDNSAYAFRYDGLRLLERTGGRLFLLPEGWTLDTGTLVVLTEQDVRIEYTHGP